MEAATRRHFFHHGDSDPAITTTQAERDACQWCQLRSFATHAALPITVVNETGDGATLPPGFRFIDRSELGAGVEPAAANFRSGCECADDDEDCMYDGCHCLAEMEEDEDSGSDEDEGKDDDRAEKRENGLLPRTRRKMFAYHSHGAKAGLLKSKILQSREPIYECHDGCACSADCPNRVVERGRQIPLQIFRTETRGWGVRTLVDIKRGQFVDRYLGEIITAAEADARRSASVVAQRKDVYLFALDKFSDPASLDPRLAGAPLEVDGEFGSGPTRFVNHSCDPGMRIFARVGDHADKHMHDLALFAVRDIAKGEELTFDYVDGLENVEDDAMDLEKRHDMTRCLCGSKNCRGFLW